MIIYRREGGLSAEDQEKIAADRTELNAAIEANEGGIYHAVEPFAEPRPSESGDAALLIGNITGDGDGDTILDPIDDIRERVSDPGGGLEVKVTGAGGLRGGRDQGLRGDQRHAARRGARARRGPADPHLPQPDLPVDPAVRGRVRRGHHALDRLRPDRARRHRQRPVLLDPLDPRARGGHGLRAAAGLQIPGGVAQTRGQARGDGARPAHGRTGDRRVRRDGHRRAAVPDHRRGRGHGRASGRSARSASRSR